MECKKSNKIRDIVRLRQILKKWRKLANPPRTCPTTPTTSATIGNSSKSMKFLKRTLSLSESSARESSNNTSVPRGYLAVCVGEEQKRYIIPTDYLGHRAFHILLREAEEEFGFEQMGVLRIPCEVPVFESILKLVEQKKDISFTVQDCRFDMEDVLGFCSSQRTPTHQHYSKSNVQII